MAMYTSLHIDPDEPCEITCSHQLNGLHPEGYPVLAIGTLSIYPTRGRLERIRAVIDAYLAAHGESLIAVDPDDDSLPDDGFDAFWERIKPQLAPDGPAELLESIRLEELKSTRCTCAACGGSLLEFDDHYHCFTCGDSARKTTTEPDVPAESLESMALEELKSDLTEAAHEVGIDPDGLTDGEVIRALVRRVAALRPASDMPRKATPAEMLAMAREAWDLRREQEADGS